MVDFTSNNTMSLDNKVVLNGVLTYTLSDKEMLQVKSILDGIVANRTVSSNANTTTQSFTTPTPTTTTSTATPYVATKDFTCKFEVKKQTIKGTDNKSLFCINRVNGWTKSEKACMNDLIKALAGIKEITVEYADKNGVMKSYKAWGYGTKKKAEEMMDTLPKIIKADVLNKRFA